MCAPTLMTLFLEPLKEAGGLASGMLYCLQSIVGAVASHASVHTREKYGVRAMFLVFMLIQMACQVNFWVNFGCYAPTGKHLEQSPEDVVTSLRKAPCRKLLTQEEEESDDTTTTASNTYAG